MGNGNYILLYAFQIFTAMTLALLKQTGQNGVFILSQQEHFPMTNEIFH